MIRRRASRSLVLTVLLGSVLLGSVACDVGAGPPTSPVDGHPATLAGTSWIVKSVTGRAPLPGAVPTITFDADTVSGTGGCNHIGGRYRYDAASGAFAVNDLGGTAMGCLQPGVMDFETAFMQSLGQARQVATGPDDELILDGQAGRVLLVHLEHP